MLKTAAEIKTIGEERMRLFRADLATLTPEQVYQKHIYAPEPAVLTPEGVQTVRDLFQRQWGINADALRIVGSTKQGFSYKPARRWELFDLNNSDIDVGVTDRDFFDDMWQGVHEYVADTRFWHKEPEFKEYHFNGWIRPDILPPRMMKQWFEWFDSIRDKRIFGRVTLRAGFYSSDYFLEHYQARGIGSIK